MAGVLLGEQNLLIDNNTSNWLQMDNIFSSKFSVYELHFYDFYSHGDTSVNNVLMSLIDSTGAVKSDSAYYGTRNYGRSNANGRQSAISYSGQSRWYVAMGSYTDFLPTTIMTIHTPFESDRITSYYCTDIGSTSEIYLNHYAGTYETNASITGFRLFSYDDGEELMMGTVAVFGLGK